MQLRYEYVKSYSDTNPSLNVIAEQVYYPFVSREPILSHESHAQLGNRWRTDSRVNSQADRQNLSSSEPNQLRIRSRKHQNVSKRTDSQLSVRDNPLSMHPQVDIFAKPSAYQSMPPSGSQEAKRRNRSGDIDNDNDDDGHRRQSDRIDRAIIYSPSTGDLSEYSRTPSPVLGCRTRELQETPTKKPLHKSNRLMLKKSVSTFFRSASTIKLGTFTPSKPRKTIGYRASSEKHISWSEGQHSAQMSIRPTQSRSRSMSTPNISHHDGMRAVWDYQPSTPSPLRKSTTMKSTSQDRQRSFPTTTSSWFTSGKTHPGRQRSSTSCSGLEHQHKQDAHYTVNNILKSPSPSFAYT